jgi:hypothetical protein
MKLGELLVDVKVPTAKRAKAKSMKPKRKQTRKDREDEKLGAEIRGLKDASRKKAVKRRSPRIVGVRADEVSDMRRI